MYRRLSGPMILAAATLLSMAYTASAATVGPVTDDLGVIRIAKGAPIQIGAYWVLSGADTALGLDEKRGVEIAFKDVGGKVLGPSAEAECRGRRLQRRGRPDCGDQACRQSADCDRAWPRLLVRRDTRRADPVAAGHRRYLHGLHRARTDRADAQAGIRRLRPHRVQRQRAGQGRRHLRAQRRSRRSRWSPSTTAARTRSSFSR